MKMSEKAVLTDCLESLKHASEHYLRAALECDTDSLRKLFCHLAIDKAEESNAVFNLMHQAGMYITEPAEATKVSEFVESAKGVLRQLGGERTPVAREMGQSDASRPRLY